MNLGVLQACMRAWRTHFPLPEKQKHLKSFLGLVTYFRDHVEGLPVLTKPLNDLTTPYKKSSSIIRTPQLEVLCKHIQEAVGNCPKLYYVRGQRPPYPCAHGRI